MRVRRISSIVLITSTVVLAGCQTAQEKQFSQNTTQLNALDPIEQSVFTAGEKFNYLDLLNSDEVRSTEVLAVDPTGTRFIDSSGCEFTQVDHFTPSTKWTNCNGDGSAEVVTEGNIWPLQVGNSVSYHIKGIHNGETWGGTKNCEVESAQNIILGTESYDTFKVVCKRKDRVKTFFMTASAKQPLVYRSKKGGQYRTHQQLIR